MAFWWGFAGASSLLLGGLLALWIPIPSRALGLVMGFGVGVLTSAVAYELVAESFETSGYGVAAGLLCGAIVYYLGDEVLDRLGAHGRKRSTAAGAALAGRTSGAVALPIVLGIVLDGVPESVVLGLTLVGGGGVGLAVLAAVFLSNLPESIAATVGLRGRGWSAGRIVGLWLLVCLASGLAAFLGYTALDSASPGLEAFVNAFAAGAILTMLADTMAPEAFENGGRAVGLATTVGFFAAFLLCALT